MAATNWMFTYKLQTSDRTKIGDRTIQINTFYYWDGWDPTEQGKSNAWSWSESITITYRSPCEADASASITGRYTLTGNPVINAAADNWSGASGSQTL